MLYRRRKSESAADPAAFPWMRPVFRYGTGLLGGLALGLGLWDVLLLQPLIMPSIPTMTEAQRSKDSVFLAFMMFPPVLIDFSLL